MRKSVKEALLGAAVVGALAGQWAIACNLGKLTEATRRHTAVVCEQVKAQKVSVAVCDAN